MNTLTMIGGLLLVFTLSSVLSACGAKSSVAQLGASQSAPVQTGSSQVSPTQQSTQSCQQLPHSLNISSLSDQQLIQYGLPTQETMKTDAPVWQTAIAHLQNRTCTASLTNLTTAPTPVSTSGATEAGYLARGGNNTYAGAMMTLKVPNVLPTIANAAATYWVGVGGGSTDQDAMAQAGISTVRSGTGSVSYTVWWDFLSNETTQKSVGEENITLTSGLNPGDTVFLYVNSNPNNSGTDEFFIQDQTTDDYVGYYLAGSQYYADGTSTEYVVQRMSSNGSLLPLSDFSTQSLTQCMAYQNGQSTMVPLGNLTQSGFNMVPGGVLYAQTSKLTNNQDFQVTWKD
jgi:hypothetical protein